MTGASPPDRLLQKLHAIYGMRLHAPRSSLADRSDYRILLARLDDPHLRMPPAIHVAGTNGKGSTIAFLKAMYEAEGYKVHVYTSPHLVRFNERIVIRGQQIDDQTLEMVLDHVMAETRDLQLTFFEIVTAMAFLAFANIPADLCLIETGMGGRIDCTNVIQNPLATIITRISYDHREFLGDTLHEIAKEKAGIMKPSAPCIIGYQGEDHDAKASHDSVMPLFDSVAGQNDTPLHRAGIEWGVSRPESDPSHFIFRYGSLQKTYPVPSLVGVHQIGNAGAALACTHVIDSIPIHDESRQAGLTRVTWPGRMQRIENSPINKGLPPGWQVWLDGGHNDSAGQALAGQATLWHRTDALPLHMVLAMKQDKDADLFLERLLPQVSSLTIIPIPGFEKVSHDPAALAGRVMTRQPDLKIQIAPDLATALTLIPARDPAARLLITGSLFLAGHVLALIKNQDRL